MSIFDNRQRRPAITPNDGIVQDVQNRLDRLRRLIENGDSPPDDAETASTTVRAVNDQHVGTTTANNIGGFTRTGGTPSTPGSRFLIDEEEIRSRVYGHWHQPERGQTLRLGSEVLFVRDPQGHITFHPAVREILREAVRVELKPLLRKMLIEVLQELEDKKNPPHHKGRRRVLFTESQNV